MHRLGIDGEGNSMTVLAVFTLLLRCCLGGSMLFMGVSQCLAQNWPSKSVRIIVPMAAGGGSDTVARLLSQKLGDHYGQQFVVDNRGGGGGLIGIGMGVKAPPDGYTLMLISGSVPATLAAHNVPNDPLGHLSGIIKVAYSPLVLVVHPALPVKNTREFIDFARARPGQLSFIVPGVGSLTHLATELFMRESKIRMQPIAYKSTGLGMTELLAGQTQFTMGGLQPFFSYIQSGRLRALAMSTAKRWPLQPEVPTVSETIPGFEAESWFALVTPKGTPAEMILTLNKDINQLLEQPETIKSFRQQGLVVSGGKPETVEQRMRQENERWIRIIKEANIRIEE